MKGVVDETPEGIDHHYFVKCKMTLNFNSRINSYLLVHFYINVESLHSLRLQGGGYTSLASLNPSLLCKTWVKKHKKANIQFS